MQSDRIFGLVILITAVAYIAAATQIQTNFFSGAFLPKLFPLLIGGVAAISSLVLVFKPDPDPDWPDRNTWGNLALAVIVLAFYSVLISPLGFILPTAFAAMILSYQISPNRKKAVLAGIGLSLGLFVVFKFVLMLGNVVAFRIPTPAKLWDAISILIPFVGH